MSANYKIIFVISFFLLLLTGGSSLSNYLVSMKATENQIKKQSLPLSINNIYTSIQKHIIEPSLVASMMSTDTFLIDWLKHDENNTQKIKDYLESIQNKYKMMASFLVSKKSLNYYTDEGVIKQISKNDPEDAWYYRFENTQERHEINLDWNQYISHDMIMFINYKIYDADFHVLGATGVGLKISYIDKMLKMFKENYQLHVTFIDKEANILLSNSAYYKSLKSINNSEQKKQILLKDNATLEYQRGACDYIMHTKYIPELNAYLLVEAKLDDFTENTKKTFYFNLGVSLFLTLIIATVLSIIFNGFHKRLEDIASHDPLTKLANRRSFTQDFEKFLLLSKRTKEPLSLLFIDLDDFKKINDTFGHDIGDIVLQEFATLIKSNIRTTDLSARWGGEEFVIAFINSSAEDSYAIAQKIQTSCFEHPKFISLLDKQLTISAGLTPVKEEDTLDSAVARADKAMYIAKTEGKNRVHLLSE